MIDPADLARASRSAFEDDIKTSPSANDLDGSHAADTSRSRASSLFGDDVKTEHATTGLAHETSASDVVMGDEFEKEFDAAKADRSRSRSDSLGALEAKSSERSRSGSVDHLFSDNIPARAARGQAPSLGNSSPGPTGGRSDASDTNDDRKDPDSVALATSAPPTTPGPGSVASPATNASVPVAPTPSRFARFRAALSSAATRVANAFRSIGGSSTPPPALTPTPSVTTPPAVPRPPATPAPSLAGQALLQSLRESSPSHANSLDRKNERGR